MGIRSPVVLIRCQEDMDRLNRVISDSIGRGDYELKLQGFKRCGVRIFALFPRIPQVSNC